MNTDTGTVSKKNTDNVTVREPNTVTYTVSAQLVSRHGYMHS